MRTTRNYYEILGLQRGATSAQVKRRYKQLVRKYHPDVASDKVMAHRLFIQITEAYQALSDPGRRRAYDDKLDLEARRVAPPYAASPQGPSSATAGYTRPPFGRSAAELIKEAQWSFIQKRFHEAASRCKEAIHVDGRNAKAYAILGDVYRAQGKIGSAIKAYSYAVQYNPSDRDSEKKLTSLIGQGMASQRAEASSVSGMAWFAVLNAVGWGVAFLLLMLINVYPGEPIRWLKLYVPYVSGWSWNLVLLMAAASATAGALLSLNGLLDHPDEELVFESSGSSWAVVPAGLILLIGSGFFFVGAAVFYTVVALIQGSLSRSILTVFACVIAIVLLATLMYNPQVRMQVVMFGGNVAFLACLVGWYIGSAMKPLSEC